MSCVAVYGVGGSSAGFSAPLLAAAAELFYCAISIDTLKYGERHSLLFSGGYLLEKPLGSFMNDYQEIFGSGNLMKALSI